MIIRIDQLTKTYGRTKVLRASFIERAGHLTGEKRCLIALADDDLPAKCGGILPPAPGPKPPSHNRDGRVDELEQVGL